MSLDALTRILVQRAWLPLVLAAAGGLAALAVARAQTPSYEAESRVSITAARPADLGQTQAINSLLRSFAAGAVTQEMAEEVAGLVPERSPGALRAAASATADEGTREVRIRVRGPDAAEAEAAAHAWATVFVAHRERANLQLAQSERVFAGLRDATTHRQYSPRTKLLTAFGAAAGLAAGLALVLLWEYRAARLVRVPQDVATMGAGPLLGVVAARVGAVGIGGRPSLAEARSVIMVVAPVLVMAGVGGLVAAGANLMRPVEYRARTRIAVEPARTSDWGQTQAIREIMRGYSEDITTRRMAEEVSLRLELDAPPARLLSGLGVAPHEDTYEIWLDYRDTDPDTAHDISRAWATVFTEERVIANQELDAVDRIYARLRDDTPVQPYTSGPTFAAMAGAVIGALAGAAAVLAGGLARRNTVAAGDPADAHIGRSRLLGRVERRPEGAR